jgi:glycosyltransferase involved in cell wall biosynthesis
MGGMGTHVAGLAPALIRAGVDVHVITPQPTTNSTSSPPPNPDGSVPGVTEEDEVVVYRVPLAESSGDISDQAQKTNHAILDQGLELLDAGLSFDLMHAHDWLVVFAAQALKQRFRFPLVATLHATERGRARGQSLQTDLQRSIHGAEWWLVYEAWRLITCSHHMASEVQAFFHAPQEKIDVVPNGVNPHRDGGWTSEDLTDCRARFGAANQRMVFSVGRLVHEKGFHSLIESVPYILAEFPDTQFVIAGRGPEAQNLMQRAQVLGVAENVFFPGFISDQERDCLYQIADCAVFPSLYEPFGIVALEAMAAGCPVVVTEVGGLCEVVQHGKTGVTVYPDDVESIAWGLLNILQNPAMAATRAERARRVVRREFSWDAVAARTIAVYQRVVDERRQIDW